MTKSKAALLFALIISMMAAVGCATNSGQSSASQALQAALDAQVSLFDVGFSDAESAGGVTVLQVSSESYSWYRHFGPPSLLSCTVITQDNSNALVRVNRTVEGTLYYHLMAGSVKRLKYFSQDFARFAKLTSADGGTTWSLAKLTPGLAKSAAYSPALGVGSVPCDLTISRVVLSSDGIVVADVTVEASVSGPWSDLSALPTVRRGSTLEVTVYAAGADGRKTLVFIWPSLKTVFRAPLSDSPSTGVYTNSSDYLTVASTETTGTKQLYVGVFDSATLSDTTSPYDFGAWHLLYQVE